MTRQAGNEILRFAQNDTGEAIRLSSPDWQMEQFVGVKGESSVPAPLVGAPRNVKVEARH